MVGGVAEGAKSGTSVLGKEGKTGSGRGCRVQNLAGECRMSLGGRNPSGTLNLPSSTLNLLSLLLWDKRDRQQGQL